MKKSLKDKIYKNGHSKKMENYTPMLEIIDSDPTISVIVPVLQEEKLLEKALSIYTPELKSKYGIELIVSDGGSSDKSIEIAEKYADIVVKHTEKRKQTISEGRNMGAEAATGEIFVFINADCLPVDPELFFNFIYSWNNGESQLSKCGALAGPVTVERGEILLKDKIFYSCFNIYVRLLNLIGLGMGRGECQVIKKEVFNKVNGYNSNIAAGEDFDLYRRITKYHKIGFAKKILVYESPRRFRKFGYFRILLSWFINSISVIFRGKAVSEDWEPVR